MKGKCYQVLGVIVLLFPSIIIAQVMRPGLCPKEIRVGYQHKYFHRRVSEYGGPEWSYGSPFVQCGLFKSMTLSVEAGLYDFTDERYGNEYRLLGVGAGIIAGVFDFEGFEVLLYAHYYEALFLGKTTPNDHQLTQGLVGGVQVDKSVSLFGQELTFLLAPAYVWDRHTYWPLGFDESRVKNIGIMLGVDLLLFEHVETFAQVVYVEYMQPRFGINVRL